MSHAGYVMSGYIATAVVLGAYAWRLVHRGRVLARALPPEDRRWSPR